MRRASVFCGYGGDPNYLIHTNLFGAANCLGYASMKILAGPTLSRSSMLRISRSRRGDRVLKESTRFDPIKPARKDALAHSLNIDSGWISERFDIVACRLPHDHLRESMFLEATGFRPIEMKLHPFLITYWHEI
jgi:hypothetical protein